MRLMRRILSVAALLSMLAIGVAGAEDFGYIDPTRPPNEPEYDPARPEALVPEQIVAHSFVLMDRGTGEVLMARNEYDQRQPASLSTVMTALLALERGAPDDAVTVRASALALPMDSSVVPLREGETLTLEALLYGMLLQSGCDAANAIAEYIAGSQQDFVVLMNEKAASLGMDHTRFANAHGYPDPAQTITARDMSLLMDAAMEVEAFRTIVGTSEYFMPAMETTGVRKLTNSNLHLQSASDYYAPDSLGGKTGFASEAGFVMAEAAGRDGVELIAVILGSGKYSRWSDVTKLFAYGFAALVAE